VSGLRVAIVGCGLIGAKRAAALVSDDELIACYDVNAQATESLAGRYGATACATLEEKAAAAGFEVLEDFHLGALLYPAFWVVKQRNRRRYAHLQGAALEDKVRADIEGTSDSAFGHLACRIEEWMLAHRVKLPLGIRGLTVLERPRERAIAFRDAPRVCRPQQCVRVKKC